MCILTLQIHIALLKRKWQGDNGKINSSLNRDISEFSTKTVIDTLEVIFQMHV